MEANKAFVPTGVDCVDVAIVQPTTQMLANNHADHVNVNAPAAAGTRSHGPPVQYGFVYFIVFLYQPERTVIR